MIVIIEDDEIAGRLLVKMLIEFFPDKKYVWLKSIDDTISFFSMNNLYSSDLLLIDFYLPDGTAWDILNMIKSNEISFSGRIILTPGIKPNNEEEKLIEKYKSTKLIVKPLALNDIKKLFE